MPKLDDANERLDAALTRLEEAVAAQRKRSGEAAGIADENRRLQEELAQLRADVTRLRETSGAALGRLDDTMGRLRNMLAE